MKKHMVIKIENAERLAVLVKSCTGLLELVKDEAKYRSDMYTAVRNIFEVGNGEDIALLLLCHTVDLSENSKFVSMKKNCNEDELEVIGLEYVSCKELNRRVRDFSELTQIIAGVGLDFYGELAETFEEWDVDDFICTYEETLDYVACICEGAGFDVDFELDDEDEVA